MNEIKRLQQLAGILTEIKVNNPNLKLYNVYIQFDDRLDNNIFVWAKNEEHAIQKVLENWPEGAEEGEEITMEQASEVYLTGDKSEDTANGYYLTVIEDENILEKLKHQPTFCWDSGT